MQAPAGALFLEGNIGIPKHAHGVVLLPYGIESDQHQHVSYTEGLAELLREADLATLVIDLLTPEEKALDAETGFFRENVSILCQRIIGLTNWLTEAPETRNLSLCYFGSGVTAAAALQAAAARPDAVVAVIAVNGRFDLVSEYLPRVTAPVLLLAGENDRAGVEAARQALEQLHAEKHLETIGGTTTIFDDPSTQEEVARIAGEWFRRCLGLG